MLHLHSQSDFLSFHTQLSTKLIFNGKTKILFEKTRTKKCIFAQMTQNEANDICKKYINS